MSSTTVNTSFDPAQHLKLIQATLGHLQSQYGIGYDTAAYKESLHLAFEQGHLIEVKRDSKLAAFVTLKALKNKEWFVLLFVTDQNHRTAGVFREMFRRISEFLADKGGTILKSNVFRQNTDSINFHKKLGFKITRENEKGFEFTLVIDDAASKAGSHITKSIQI